MTLAEAIAAELESSLLSAGTASLPSLRVLADTYRVSLMTMRRAATMLRERGVLRFTQGSKIRPAATPALPSPKTSSSQALAEQIRRGIDDMTYRVGRQLPKVGYFARELHMSPNTVRMVLRGLAREQLIWQRGKSWIVGKPHGPLVGRLCDLERPVILIIQPRENSWRGLHSSQRTAGFCSQFMQEADASGYELIYALITPDPAGHQFIPGGLDQVTRFIRGLGDRYRGALIAASSAEVSLDGMRLWSSKLTAFKRPVVWFDRYDEPGVSIERSALFTRCHFCESSAIEAAVSVLHDSGHRNVAYAFYGGARGWVVDRLGMLRECGRACSPPIEFDVNLSVPREVIDWREISPERWELILQNLLRNGTRCVRAFIAEGLRVAGGHSESGIYNLLVRRNYPFLRLLLDSVLLIPLLRKGTVTAIVTANDNNALYLYRWLIAAGIKVPRDLSVVSFDNNILLVPYPVSTVDFGFGRLAYNAFHLIAGDLPVRGVENGSLAAEAWVVHRGSVGPPRPEPFTMDSRGVLW